MGKFFTRACSEMLLCIAESSKHRVLTFALRLLVYEVNAVRVSVNKVTHQYNLEVEPSEEKEKLSK